MLRPAQISVQGSHKWPGFSLVSHPCNTDMKIECSHSQKCTNLVEKNKRTWWLIAYLKGGNSKEIYKGNTKEVWLVNSTHPTLIMLQIMDKIKDHFKLYLEQWIHCCTSSVKTEDLPLLPWIPSLSTIIIQVLFLPRFTKHDVIMFTYFEIVFSLTLFTYVHLFNEVYESIPRPYCNNELGLMERDFYKPMDLSKQRNAV